MTERRRSSARRLAVAGVVAGLAAVAVLGAISLVAAGPEPPAMALGQAALLVGVAGPFLLAAVALDVPRDDVRAGVWLGAGSVTAIVSVLGAISLVSLLLLPGAALLLAAGVRAAAGGAHSSGLVTLVALGVAAVAAGSGMAWGTMSEAACWYRAGEVWVQPPFSNRISIEDPLTMGVCGSGPTPPGVAVSMGVWVVAATALVAARAWRSGAPRPA